MLKLNKKLTAAHKQLLVAGASLLCAIVVFVASSNLVTSIGITKGYTLQSTHIINKSEVDEKEPCMIKQIGQRLEMSQAYAATALIPNFLFPTEFSSILNICHKKIINR
ncbi:MAG: hypothetical protein SGJ04_02230 [Bacteroidota bacterium]|nr:hypothetical protein [Bacteroidota bacterium]